MKHYAVIDLEMCTVPKAMRGKYSCKMEIIQIGVSLLNEDYEEVAQFNRFVKPRYGYIDAFIRNLTGIGKKQMRDAIDLAAAIDEFTAWLPQGEVIPVSWSDNDERQVRKELAAKGIHSEKMNYLLENWLDCQPMFAEKMNNNRCYSLFEALVASDINVEGRLHDGLVDARNTARLFAKMQTEKDFRLNTYYSVAHNDDEPTVLSSSLGDLLSALNFQFVATA